MIEREFRFGLKLPRVPSFLMGPDLAGGPPVFHSRPGFALHIDFPIPTKQP